MIIADVPPMTTTNALSILVIGALMGMLGQGARAVIGLKGMSDDAKSLNLSPNDLFEASRLVTSLLIGVVVGLAAAVIYIANNGSADSITYTVLLGWAVSAYAGTDALEGFISQYLSPDVSDSTVQKVAAAVTAKLAAAKPPSARSLVQKALQIAMGILTEQPTDDLSRKLLGLAGFDYDKVLSEINVQLSQIKGATLLGTFDAKAWQTSGTTVATVISAVAAVLPH